MSKRRAWWRAPVPEHVIGRSRRHHRPRGGPIPRPVNPLEVAAPLEENVDAVGVGRNAPIRDTNAVPALVRPLKADSQPVFRTRSPGPVHRVQVVVLVPGHLDPVRARRQQRPRVRRYLVMDRKHDDHRREMVGAHADPGAPLVADPVRATRPVARRRHGASRRPVTVKHCVRWQVSEHRLLRLGTYRLRRRRRQHPHHAHQKEKNPQITTPSQHRYDPSLISHPQDGERPAPRLLIEPTLYTCRDSTSARIGLLG